MAMINIVDYLMEYLQKINLSTFLFFDLVFTNEYYGTFSYFRKGQGPYIFLFSHGENFQSFFLRGFRKEGLLSLHFHIPNFADLMIISLIRFIFQISCLENYY